jgi:hypothetical protein
VKKNPNAVGIDKVIVDELSDISRRRGEDPGTLDRPWEAECHAKKLFGVCLSGGGIRSATFALGVLQGLTEKELLPRADYLSTVSGGGYIGSWLQGVLYRDHTAGYEQLIPDVPTDASKDPISFLRKYSNYLAPRVGLSLDSIVIPIIWLRNTMLNQTIIVAAFAALFLLLSLPGSGIHELDQIDSLCFSWAAMLVAGVLGVFAVSVIGYNLRKITNRQFTTAQETAFKPGKGTESVGKFVVLPLVSGVVSLLFALVSWPQASKALWTAIFESPGISWLERGSNVFLPWGCLALLLWLLLTLLQWGGGFVQCFERSSHHPTWLAWLHLIWMPLVSALFMWALFVAVSLHLAPHHGLPMSLHRAEYTVAVGPPLYLLVLHLGIALQIGLMGRDFPDSTREWLARAGALMLSVAAIWVGLFAVAIFAPFWVAKLWLTSGAGISSAAGAWLLSTLMSVLAGKSAKTKGVNDHGPSHSIVLDYVARYGPFIAITGFLVAVAFGVQLLLRHTLWSVPGLLGRFVGGYWDFFPDSGASHEHPLAFLVIAVVIAVVIAAVLSLRLDINEFSLSHFYKNRLVRCYMGASAGAVRKPDPFTGFDPKDDIALDSLKCESVPLPLQAQAPYPILNATLTVTEGSELATQERKAASWIFTPRFSGFIPSPSEANRLEERLSENGFVPTSEILGGGVHLGTATGISGAALNPSSGFHTAPQTAFLLTLFNVRLGWWVGNPRSLTYRRPGPLFALWWLTRELFGFADERSAYLNLSDGGNFENLGLYELVRRRCHFVIAVDAEEDADYKFGSLGGAVRKCRADFGAEIEIDPRPIRPKNGHSHSHCVVGRIRYPEPGSSPGWLLYIKASLTGDEPADVQEYQRSASEFPQQSTLNQFFSESQFESYRRLGLHILRTAIDRNEAANLEDLFSRLAIRWESAPPAPEGAFVHHAEAYAKLMRVLNDSADLESLDSDIIERLPQTAHADTANRKAFFFHLDLLQFMENVFFDLNFNSAHAWNHPANEGWKKLFEYWAGQELLKTVWSAQKLNYSASFQNFFDDLGNDDVAPPEGRRI